MGYSAIETHPIRCPTQDDRGVAPIGMDTSGSFFFSSLPWGRSPERPGAPTVDPTPHLFEDDLPMGTFHPMGMADQRRSERMEGIHMAHATMRRSTGLTLPPTNQHSIISTGSSTPRRTLRPLPHSPRPPAANFPTARAPRSPRTLKPLANRPEQLGSARGVRGAVRPDAVERLANSSNNREELQAAMARMMHEQRWTTSTRFSYGSTLPPPTPQ